MLDKDLLRQLPQGELADEIFRDMLLKVYELIDLMSVLPIDRAEEDDEHTFHRAWWMLHRGSEGMKEEVINYINERWIQDERTENK